MSFAEIEQLIGAMLPRIAAQLHWWSNISDRYTTHVQHRAWGDAGYHDLLLAGNDRLRFRRTL